MKTVERLKLFIDFKGVSFNAFDKLIDAGNGYIGAQVRKNGSIGSDVIEKIISTFPDLNAAWLLTGEGEMLKTQTAEYLPPHRAGVVNDEKAVYQQLPPGPQSKKAYKNVSPTVSPSIILNPKIITVDHRGNENIVYVPVRARAGYLVGYGDPEYVETLPAFGLPGLTNGTYRAFEVDGDSMHPTLKDKEMVIGQWIEKLDYIREDRVHILVTKNEGIIIKRLLNRIDKYGYIIAKSDAYNDRNLYKNILIRPEDIQEIWYSVWHGGFDFSAPGDLWKRQNNNEADITVLQSTVEELKQLISQAGIITKRK